MYSENFSMGRECSVCGAPISDDNPDGIGCTCRKVWNHAYNSAFYHFHGLEIWSAKSTYWAHLYVKTFSTTKFRSEFKKGFYITVSKMVSDNNIRLSRKMFDIIRSQLVGNDDDLNPGYPKLTGVDNRKAREGEEILVDNMKRNWQNHTMTDDEIEYVRNLAKKFYAEEKAA